MIFAALRRAGAVARDASLYELMTALRITRAKARNLIFDIAIRGDLDGAALDSAVKRAVARPRGFVMDGSYIALGIEDPLIQAHMKEGVRALGHLTDASFDSAVVRLKPGALAALVEALMSPSARRGGQPMDELLREYLPIVIFLGLAVGLGLILVLAAWVLAVRNPDPEKTSAYECGFNAFDDARMKFDVRFYLVSILFIIFDLEIAFLFPWAAAFGQLSDVAFWSMIVFLGVLTVGFAYEWKKGALEWE